MTIVDIQYYNELTQLCKIDQESFDINVDDFSKLCAWIQNIKAVFDKKKESTGDPNGPNILEKLDSELEKIVTHYGLAQ